MRRVRHEIGDRHFAGEQESHWAGEQADEQKQAADQFEDAGDAEQREERRAELGRREAEQFLRAMLEEEQRRDDTQRRQGIGTPGRKQGLEIHLV